LADLSPHTPKAGSDVFTGKRPGVASRFCVALSAARSLDAFATSLKPTILKLSGGKLLDESGNPHHL
jgi:hypothetical protein